MYLIMVCGMFVWCSLYVSVCMLTVSNALLMCSGGLFWLKPVAMVELSGKSRSTPILTVRSSFQRVLCLGSVRCG